MTCRIFNIYVIRLVFCEVQVPPRGGVLLEEEEEEEG
jgi:hypothetical protein